MSDVEMVTCHCVDGSTKQVPRSELQFRTSVYGVTFKGEHVLLVPQWDGYDLPGGGIDIGETIEQALKREVFEETGLTVTPLLDPILKADSAFFIHPATKKAYHWFVMYYTCKAPQGELTDAHFSEEEKQYSRTAEWVPLSKVHTLKFYNRIDSVALIREAWELLND